MKYRPHISHPGYGWIEPLFDMDAPLVAEETAEAIIQAFAQIKAENAALAEQNAKLRAALEGSYDYVEEAEQRYLVEYGESFKPRRLKYIRDIKASCDNALNLPNISTPAINRIKAEGMEEAAEWVALIRDDWAGDGDNHKACGADYLACSLRAKADELRGKS